MKKRQAEVALETSQSWKEFERATQAREEAESSWFKIGLAKKKETEKEAKKAYWRVRDEGKDLETRLMQNYPEDWAKANSGLIDREIQKRLGQDSGERFKKALGVIDRHDRQKAQHLELERQKSLTLGKRKTGPDIDR